MGGLSRILLVALFLLSTACGSDVADSEDPAPSSHTPDQPLSPGPVNSDGAVRTKGLLEVNRIVDKLSADGLRIGNLKGYVQNDYGEDCWYTQSATADDSVSYFYESLTGSDTLMIFEDLGCMTPQTPIGMDYHQRMVNQAISNWYSKPDADFQTKPGQLKEKSRLQIRGWCIQSKTYPSKGILVDYFVDGQSLASVVHNYSVGGCKGVEERELYAIG